MRKRLTIGFCLALFAAGTVSAIGRVLRPAVQNVGPSILVTGPATWVPFEAERTIARAGAVTTRARVYRASNGSMREETYTPAYKLVAITIHNIPKATMYSQRSPTTPTWESRPIVLPRDGYVPRNSLSLESSTVSDKELQVQGGFKVLEQAGGGEGLMVVRHVAPDLNFYPLRVNDGDSQMELSNVVIGEPDPALFEPPAGALIVPSASRPPLRLGRFSMK